MASTCTSAQSSTGTDVTALLNHLAERLCKDYPNFSPDQITPQTYSVTVSFRGSGLNVDVVPILYDGDPQRELVTLHDGRPNR